MPKVAARLAVLAAAVLVAALVASPALATSPNLVISQVYGGGGNTGAPYANDYIELYNRGTSTVYLAGLSLQYASATGTGNFGANTGQITEFVGGALIPGQYLLVQEAGGAVGAALPSPDVADGTPINMSATGGKVALVTGTTSLGCNGGSTPCTAAALARIVDLVGYDGANFFEGSSAAPTLSNTTAALRNESGCADTDDNGADFTAGAPAPRNMLSPLHFCDADSAPKVSSTSPANNATDVAQAANVAITFTEAVGVDAGWYAISCSKSGSHSASVSGGPTTYTLDPSADFAAGDTCTVTVTATAVHDVDTVDPPDTMAADYTASFTVVQPPVAIHDIQGAAHISPYATKTVSGVTGIVTAKRSNGFYLQDPNADADPATSEGIFVFTSSAPNSVSVGDFVRVGGRVSEFRPGGSSSSNLTTTEITLPSIAVLSTGNALPAVTVIGAGGVVPPTELFEDDATGDVETSGVFDPAFDGLDFWESLEGMRLQLNNPVAVGPQNSFGELPVVGDDGGYASVRTARGGLLLQPNDVNPERLILDDAIVATPAAVNVGDHFSGPAIGVLDYNFGNFMLELTQSIDRVDSGLQKETTAAAGAKELSVATFNVENLDPGDGAAKFDALASRIVGHLRSPDIVTLEEVQDDNGATNDGVVTSDVTLDTLVAAIEAAGGPKYAYTYIAPVDDQDGGEPGGNIRIAFLYRTDRGVALAPAPKGGSTDAETVVGGHLALNPGRIAPTDGAWNASRKPLAAEFTYRGQTFFVIGNHFNSKGGDQALAGHFQPPTRSSEVQRHQQATLVNAFVDSILESNPNAGIVVLGDLNDFQFSETVQIVEGGVLVDMIDTLPLPERYSYVFEGNSQVLDHILVSNHVAASSPAFDVVHVNSEFADQASDHDPSVLRIGVNDAPDGSAGGPYTVAEGGSTTVSATGSDANGDAVTYAWDLDNDGTFETAGQTATFSAAALDGPAVRTVSVRISDGDLSVVRSASVTVTNVAPTASLSAPATALAGLPFTIALESPSDPSAADTAAGFTYAFDCGAGYDAAGTSPSATCTTTDVGPRTIRARIGDKDGGATEYTATVTVGVTPDSLCTLTQQYVTKDGVAASLCAKLRNGAYGAYANEVRAQSGKALSADQAETLTRLAARL